MGPDVPGLARSGDRAVCFEDVGTNGILNYVPALRLGAAATNKLDLTARIVDLRGGKDQTIIPDPTQPSAFFRIAGFAGSDTDGDGLSDLLERFIGTRTNTFDNDLDGFGDGVELVNNSSPTNPDSKPSINRASFAAPSSTAREGQNSKLYSAGHTFFREGQTGDFM